MLLKIKSVFKIFLLSIILNYAYATSDLEKIMPAVVHLSIQPNSSYIKNTIGKVGSGVILDAKSGIIVTNAHLVYQAKNVVVTLNDGRHFMGKILGQDAATDLAVIKIKPDNLVAIVQDVNLPVVGDTVTAIGSPFGLAQTVTRGIISGMHRHIGIEGVENFIQTDAPINPGNSGGALVNAHGKLVGINTAILSKTGNNVGIGFAIPINMVQSITKQIVQYGNVKRGLIGIVAQTINPGLSKALRLKNTQGAVINKVIDASPAQKAGLLSEDLIVAINGSVVHNSAEMKSLVAIVRVGDRVNLTIERKGKIINKKVALVSRLLDKKETSIIKGLIVERTTRMLGNGEQIKGIRVIHAKNGSVAWLGGLVPNDIIVKVDHKAVNSIDGFKKIVANKNRLLLSVLRGNSKLFLVLNN